jgi:hypothetical protein
MNNTTGNNTTDRKAGISLIVFIVLLVFTMVHHPAGGSIEHLMNVMPILVITHAVAIFSLPFGWVGFRGFTQRLGADNFWSILGFAMVSLALIAALLAGTTNGMVLPIFLQSYKDASPETMAAINPIMRYGFAINHAFDYIYTGAFCVAILCWSVAIVLTRKLPVWVGWFGMVVALGTAAIFVSGVSVNSLHGLHIFGGCVLVWVLVVAGALGWRNYFNFSRIRH